MKILSEDRTALVLKLISLESWMRKVIEYVSTNKEDFKSSKTYKKLKEEAELRIKDNPKYERWVDSLFFAEEISLFIQIREIREKDTVTNKFIKGKVGELNEIRNNLFHSNSISDKQFKMMDFIGETIIDLIQNYFMEENKDEQFNVPTIVLVEDGWGRSFNRPPNKQLPKKTLYVGDAIQIFPTIDSRYSEDDYHLEWFIKTNGAAGKRILDKDSPLLIYQVEEKDVSINTIIICHLIQSKNWHKHGSFDDELVIPFEIRPQPEE
ncbi:MAG: hypothetical protein NXI20_17790 [bacterium]|nr:hypothetical protein [bacterium]